jgi:hypothetical protein
VETGSDLDRYVDYIGRKAAAGDRELERLRVGPWTPEPTSFGEPPTPAALEREFSLEADFPEDDDHREELLRVAAILAAGQGRKGPEKTETLGAYTEALAAQVDADVRRLRCAVNFYREAFVAFLEHLAERDGSSVARVLGGHEYKAAREAVGLPERKRCGCGACSPAKVTAP